jgi:hypothetical protein
MTFVVSAAISIRDSRKYVESISAHAGRAWLDRGPASILTPLSAYSSRQEILLCVA